MISKSRMCCIKQWHVGVILCSIGFMIVLVMWSGQVSPYSGSALVKVVPQSVSLGRVSESKNQSTTRQLQKVSKKTRIVLIGAGPTTLGALYRLYDIGVLKFSQIQILVFERESVSGGLASTTQDNNGFLWSNGYHDGTVSQYMYFSEALNSMVQHWNRTQHDRRPVPFMFKKGQNDINEFIPLQNRKGGHFIQKYYRKMWDSKEMNMEQIINRRHSSDTSDMGWEGLHFSVTGGIWNNVTDRLPRGWFNYNSEVVGIDINNKQLTVQISNHKKEKIKSSLHYDVLISTTPLDLLIRMISDTSNGTYGNMKQLADQLLYSRVHIIGLGIFGKPPKALRNKSIIYFPDSDVPFHRGTVFYSNGNHWSMMFEVAQPIVTTHTVYSKEDLIQRTIKAVEQYGFIVDPSQIVSRYYNLIDHGYPIPSITRDSILAEIQPWLESHSIYSRGLFGGWKYEVGRQDDSFMQGVEIVDRVLLNVPEQIYSIKRQRNVTKAPSRTFVKGISRSMDYEFVIARCRENVDWMLPYAEHTHIYNKGCKDNTPDFRFQSWTNLCNVGREGHTYLYHIVHNYYTLADVTVFLQGQLRGGENKRCYADNVFKYVTEAREKGISYKAHEQWNNWDYGKTKNGSKRVNNRIHNDTAGEYWNRYFEFRHPKSITVNYYGCISVIRERIHKRPRKMYEALMNSLAYGAKPKEGYFMEKFWVALFSLFKDPDKS